MRTTNNLFRKVHNYIHFMGWFTEFERKCNILEIFHYFQYFERFRSIKKWQISKPKIVDWYLDFTKEFYTTLKSVISSFKTCFQNYGQFKRKFLRPKNTSSTFQKFELSSLSGPMLKTRKNTIRNQFEQQWFNLMSSAFINQDVFIQRSDITLKPFAHKKGRKKRSNIFVKHFPTTTKQSGTPSEWENMTSSSSFLETVLMVKNWKKFRLGLSISKHQYKFLLTRYYKWKAPIIAQKRKNK